jgi:hypothetical protein
MNHDKAGVRLRRNGLIQVVNAAQLKRCRMLIRAGIPVAIRSIEEDYLIQRLRAIDAEAFNDWYWVQCELDEAPTREQFMHRLRKLARASRIKHWLLKESEE